MEDLTALLERGIEQHQAGHLPEAVALYRRVLDSTPAHVETLYLLGTALLQLGEFEACAGCLEQVVEARPEVPDARNNLGVAYKALGRWEEATKAFEATIRAHPEYEQAFYNLGALMEDRGLFADAEKCYRRCLELNPSDEQTQMSLGNVLSAQKRWAEAESCFREVLAQRPQDVDVYVNLAYVLIQREQLEEAAELYRQVLAVRPQFHQVHNNLSYVYERQGKLEAALDSANQAVRLQPDYADGYNNLGTALRSLHRLDEAAEAFERAIELQDEFPLAEYNLGATRLMQQRYLEGWPGYEKRTELLETPPRTFEAPQWEGEPRPGETLFVHSDQGFGDTIQFVRFLPMAKERFEGRVVLECQPELRRLLEGVEGADELIVEGSPLPEFQQHVSLVSLPRILGIGIDSLPGDVPYLPEPGSPSEALTEMLASLPEAAFKVGLVWQGNPEQARDVVRSCPAEELAPLFAVEGVAFVSLQTGKENADTIASVCRSENVWDAGSLLSDFADTAALMTRLDLVVTVDTATAHLAGALGLTTWTMLCHTPDWRWHLERSDSSWYPTMRLFRQPQWGDWGSVVREVRGAVENRE